MAAGSRLAAQTALIPAMLIALVVYCGSTGWTIWISMTSSRMLPSNNFVGLRQYEILFANGLAGFGAEPRGVRRVVHRPRPRARLLLAVLIDQRIWSEDRCAPSPVFVFDVLHRHRPPGAGCST
jgi:glucose/mannose transport system permease protein